MVGMVRQYEACNGTFAFTRPESWLGATMLVEGQRLGLPPMLKPVMPFVLVRNSSHEPSAHRLCRCTHPEIDLCLASVYPDEFNDRDDVLRKTSPGWAQAQARARAQAAEGGGGGGA